jgi:hypothetical protein
LASSAAKTSAQGAPSPQRQFEGSAPPLCRAASRRGAPRPCAPGPKLRGTTRRRRASTTRAAAHFRRKHVHAIANSALLDLARRRGEALQDTFAILLDILEHAQV